MWLGHFSLLEAKWQREESMQEELLSKEKPKLGDPGIPQITQIPKVPKVRDSLSGKQTTKQANKQKQKQKARVGGYFQIL